MAKHDNKKTNTYHCPCDLRQAKTYNFLSKSCYDRTALFNVKYPKMLSFSLVAEALAGLIYHRPSGENFSFLSWRLFKGELQRENKLISYERAFQNAGERYVNRWDRSSRSRVIKL